MTYTEDSQSSLIEISILKQYVCVYIDDFLVASHRVGEIMDLFGMTYRLKDDANEPDIYL